MMFFVYLKNSEVETSLYEGHHDIYMSANILLEFK